MTRVLLDIKIDEALPSWNEFIGTHYRVYSKIRDRWKILTLVALQARSEKTVPITEDFPLTLLVIVGKKRGVLDSSNIMTKIVEDALVGKMLPNDTPEYVEEVRQRSRRAESDFTRVVLTTNREEWEPVGERSEEA